MGTAGSTKVEHSMALLRATIDLARTINVAGWSRGAIICLIIAPACSRSLEPRHRCQLNKTNSEPSAIILSLDEAESGRAKAGRGSTSSIKTSLDGCQE